MEKNYEECLKSAGELGLYQTLFIMAILLYPFIHSMNNAIWNFTSPYQRHWCAISALKNYSYEEQKYIAIPYDQHGEYDKCRVFDLPWSNYTYADFAGWNRSLVEHVRTIKCEQWEFDISVYDATLQSQVRCKHLCVVYIWIVVLL